MRKRGKKCLTHLYNATPVEPRGESEVQHNIIMLQVCVRTYVYGRLLPLLPSSYDCDKVLQLLVLLERYTFLTRQRRRLCYVSVATAAATALVQPARDDGYAYRCRSIRFFTLGN